MEQSTGQKTGASSLVREKKMLGAGKNAKVVSKSQTTKGVDGEEGKRRWVSYQTRVSNRKRDAWTLRSDAKKPGIPTQGHNTLPSSPSKTRGGIYSQFEIEKQIGEGLGNQIPWITGRSDRSLKLFGFSETATKHQGRQSLTWKNEKHDSRSDMCS